MTYTYFFKKIKNATSRKELYAITKEMRCRDYSDRAAQILYNVMTDAEAFMS